MYSCPVELDWEAGSIVDSRRASASSGLSVEFSTTATPRSRCERKLIRDIVDGRLKIWRLSRNLGMQAWRVATGSAGLSGYCRMDTQIRGKSAAASACSRPSPSRDDGRSTPIASNGNISATDSRASTQLSSAHQPEQVPPPSDTTPRPSTH